jgi:hypothetical protein
LAPPNGVDLDETLSAVDHRFMQNSDFENGLFSLSNRGESIFSA